MTEQEMQQLIARGGAIDSGEAAHAEAEATGMLDEKGAIIIPDPNQRAMEWMFVGEILGLVVRTVMPEVADHYTDKQSLALAHAFVPVADKYGWSGNTMSPELGLAMAGIGFAMPAVMAYRARKAAAVQEEGEADGSRQ